MHAEIIRSTIKLNKNMKLLDIGGGTGEISNYFVNDVKEISILDPSKEMLSKIDSNKIKRFCGSAEKIPFKNNSFDIIYCVDSLHHFTNSKDIKEWRKVIRTSINEMSRVLNKKGTIIIIEFNPQKIGGKIIKFIENSLYNFGSSFYDPNSLGDLFKTEGMSSKLEYERGHTYVLKITKNI